MTEVLARLDGITRHFGHVKALDSANLEIHSGEIHGILGENGAGKTTRLSILGGIIHPDVGFLEVDGSRVRLQSARAAWKMGIGLVHQHFTLVPGLSVLENLALGRRHKGRRWTLHLKEIRKEASQLSKLTGLTVPFEASIEELGVGDRQRIEILKALLRDPQLLVLDEPTAVLAPAEIDQLFRLLRTLAEEGRAVVLVAHKLDEILSIADRVTVLRQGRTVMTAARADVDTAILTDAMVGPSSSDGEAFTAPAENALSALGQSSDSLAQNRESGNRSVAKLKGVDVYGPQGGLALQDVGLEVMSGEVIGVAGVEGNGQRELALVLSGRQEVASGKLEIPEHVGFIPQDRNREGLAAEFNLTENVALALHRDPQFRWGPLLRWNLIELHASEIRSRFKVKSSGERALARELSGGNQQRLVVGRELSRMPELLIAENPTRGLDFTATAFVRGELKRLAHDTAAGVVLISTDLDEILEVADRVFVILRGKLTPVPSRHDSREAVGAMMLGSRLEVH